VAAIDNGAAFHKGREFSPGWGLCQGSTRLAGRRGYSESASAGTDTCASSSCMAPDPLSSGSSESGLPSVHGSISWRPERPSMWWSQRQPTSWPESPGPFSQSGQDYRAAVNSVPETVRKRRLRLGSADRAPHFTAPRRLEVTTKVCTGQLRRSNSSQRRARNLLPKMVSNDRPVYQEEHAAQLIMARERLLSTCRPNTFAQTCRSTLRFSLAVVRRTIHFGRVVGNELCFLRDNLPATFQHCCGDASCYRGERLCSSRYRVD
jgi:hypothetical protein